METPIYLNAIILFVFLTIVVTGLIIYALRYALSKAAWSKNQKRKVFWLATTGLLGWLGILAFGANQQFFSDFSAAPPRFVLVIAPPWIFIAWVASRKDFRYLLSLVPPAWVVCLQSFRVVVEVVLWIVFVAGLAPIQMTFEGRNLDILVGLTAPFAGYFLFRNKIKVGWGVGWNIFGLILLMNIVITSILSAPTPLRVFWNEPANTFVTTVPFIWLPGFLVPVALAMHVFSLIQVFSGQKEEASTPARKTLQQVAQ